MPRKTSGGRCGETCIGFRLCQRYLVQASFNFFEAAAHDDTVSEIPGLGSNSSSALAETTLAPGLREAGIDE